MACPKVIRIRVAGVLHERGKVLLVCHEKQGERYWLLPGGGVDFGETLQAALQREFYEETSLRIRVGEFLCMNETIASDGSRHGLHLTFMVERKSGTLKVRPDTRLLSASFVSWEGIKEIPFRPPIGKFLVQAYRKKFKVPPRFLGNLWRP